MRLGDILVEKDLASRQVIEKGLRIQEKIRSQSDQDVSLGQVLIQYELCDEAYIHRALSFQNLNREPFSTRGSIESQYGPLQGIIFNAITQKPFVSDLASKEILVCRDQGGRPVILRTVNAFKTLRSELMATQSSVRQVFYSDKQIKDRLANTIPVTQDLIVLLRDGSPDFRDSSTVEHTDAERTFAELAEQAYEAGANDIHFYVDKQQCQIKFRVNGSLRRIDDWPTAKADQIISVGFQSHGKGGKSSHWQKNSMQRRRLRIPTSDEYVTLDMRYEHAPGDDDSYHAVCRLLPNDRRELHKVVPLEALGLTHAQARDLRTACQRSDGVIIISGPTGSGKSTTLAQCVKWLHDHHDGDINILTVEAPIERELPAFQAAVSDDDDDAKAEEYQESIKSMLRRDPDFGMVGEIRDPKSAAAMVSGVQSGHPIITTTHAQSSVEIIERMAGPGMQVPLSTLASPSFISALGYQMLLPKLDNKLKMRVTSDNATELLSADMIEHLKTVCDDIDNNRIYVKGTSSENPEGYAGMTICAEVLTPDKTARDHFRNLEIEDALEHWKKLGQEEFNPKPEKGDPMEERVLGFTAMHHAIKKMKRGIVDPNDVEEYFGPLNLFESKEMELKEERAETDAYRRAGIEPGKEPKA